MKSDTLSILRKLSPEENNQFKNFLLSPYFCHNKSVVLLFRELLHFYPLYKLSHEKKIVIYRKIYKSKDYNDSTLRSLFHSLRIALEDFLIIDSLFKNSTEKQIYLLGELNKRNIPGVFGKKIRLVTEEVSQTGNILSSSNLLNRFKLELLSYNFNKSKKTIVNAAGAYLQFNSIERSNLILTMYYLTEVVSDYVNKQIHYRKYDIKVSPHDGIISCISIKELEKFFLNTELYRFYSLYKDMYELFKEFDSPHNYKKYKDNLLGILPELDKTEISQHYSVLLSYSILRKNKHDEQFFKHELWDLYSEILDKDLYRSENNTYMDTGLYRSVLFLGIELCMFSKLKTFIDTYSTRVNPAEISNMYNLGYAYYYYSISKYEKALEFTQKISLTDFIYKYDVKNLMIKIYLETGASDSLLSLAKSYKQFLKNDRVLNKEIKKGFSRFLHYAEVFTGLNKIDNIEITYIIKNLTEEKVYSRDWLIEKFNSFSKQKSLQSS